MTLTHTVSPMKRELDLSVRTRRRLIILDYLAFSFWLSSARAAQAACEVDDLQRSYAFERGAHETVVCCTGLGMNMQSSTPSVTRSATRATQAGKRRPLSPEGDGTRLGPS